MVQGKPVEQDQQAASAELGFKLIELQDQLKKKDEEIALLQKKAAVGTETSMSELSFPVITQLEETKKENSDLLTKNEELKGQIDELRQKLEISSIKEQALENEKKLLQAKILLKDETIAREKANLAKYKEE